MFIVEAWLMRAAEGVARRMTAFTRLVLEAFALVGSRFRLATTLASVLTAKVRGWLWGMV